jgi:hypothetical protein
MSTTGKVNLSGLKNAVMNYSENEPIRKVILSEPDEMDNIEFYYKVMVWLKLLPKH